MPKYKLFCQKKQYLALIFFFLQNKIQAGNSHTISNYIMAQDYQELIAKIGDLLTQSRTQAAASINSLLVQTYWSIGKHIIEFEQKGQEKAAYGTKIFDQLSKDLSKNHGKGFGRSNLVYIRKLYLKYPIGGTLSHQLNWSIYYELLKIEDELERSFYEKQCIIDKWSVRELKRQKETALFHRLALSKDKEGVMNLAKGGLIVEKPEDMIREPYILDFLKIPENYLYTESELEKKLISHLQTFLLELGKGFAFVGRQYRITLDNTHFFVDLVFYHIKLKCYVLIDLKRGKADHADIGQMNMYLNYFIKEMNEENDSPPVGIILAAEKENVMIEYAMGNMLNQLFVSKYQLHLPDKKLLEAQLRTLLTET